jgi:hypothetical protein
MLFVLIPVLILVLILPSSSTCPLPSSIMSAPKKIVIFGVTGESLFCSCSRLVQWHTTAVNCELPTVTLVERIAAPWPWHLAVWSGALRRRGASRTNTRASCKCGQVEVELTTGNQGASVARALLEDDKAKWDVYGVTRNPDSGSSKSECRVEYRVEYEYEHRALSSGGEWARESRCAGK